MSNIIVADDHDLVRDTIAAYLEAGEQFKVFTANSFDGAMALMGESYGINLLILDYNMPGMNGLDGITQVKKNYPNCKVALMSGVANKDVANSAMERGADGFIPKSLPTASLVNAIKFILLGERYFPFDFAPSTGQGETPVEFSKLSEREMQTLEQLCIGLSNKEIARNLDIQEVTVKLHVKNLMAKLGVTNRTQAALLAKDKHLF